MKKLIEKINKLNPNLILITSHINSDPDGMCSAVALKELLKKLGINSNITIGYENSTKVTRKIIEKLQLNIKQLSDTKNYKPDLIILIDVSNLEIIGKIKDLITNNIPFIIIDHHHFEINKKYPPIYKIIKEDYTSTAELIYEMFEFFNIELGIIEAKNLLLGILYDTKHFIIASNRTFHIVSKLISTEINYKDIIKLLRYPMPYSEKIARLKAGKRMKIHKMDDWILVTSYVSSHEASACRSLITAGADIAIVESIKNKNLRISFRSSQKFYEETNISLGDICVELSNNYNKSNEIILSGGGHSTAAGLNKKGIDKSIMSKIIELLKIKLK